MIEDKLNKDEAIRAECLDKAILVSSMDSTPGVIIDMAKKFEAFINKENNS